MLSIKPLLTTLALAVSLPALAATPITGVVTNKTTNKPAVGDTVTLVKLAQGMQDSTTTKTDSQGRFKLEVPDDGIHLVRVTHDKANYFQPAPPGTTTVSIDVYNASEHVDGVTTTVQEMHFETSGNELHGVEVIQVSNTSSPAMTQFSPGGFDFYLPVEARVVKASAMRDNLPVPASAVPVGDPGHFTFIFPIRPGETQFGVLYSMPYSGSYKFEPKLTSAVSTLAIVVPKSMKVTGNPGTPFTLAPAQPGAPGGTDTYMAQNVSPSQPLGFTLTGTGSLPRDTGSQAESQGQGGDQGSPTAATDNTQPAKGIDNPLDPNGNRDPIAKYKWWIVAGLAILLVLGAGLMLKKPTDAAPLAYTAPLAPTPAGPNALLAALKEELFALETEHLQQRISPEDYAQAKAALELVLRRALSRTVNS